MARQPAPTRERIVAASARHPKWKGCGFLRTTAELAHMPGHPAIKVGAGHKKRFEGWMRDAIEAEGVEDGLPLARQIVLLLDGSFAVALLHPTHPTWKPRAKRHSAS